MGRERPERAIREWGRGGDLTQRGRFYKHMRDERRGREREEMSRQEEKERKKDFWNESPRQSAGGRKCSKSNE